MAANGERIGGELGIFRYNPTERDHLASYFFGSSMMSRYHSA